MGVGRVTLRMMADRVLTNITDQSERILELQEQLSTGLRVNRPSDDPLNTRRAIDATGQIAKYKQFLANITTVSPQLTETDTSLSTIHANIQRVHELALQGASSTNGQTQRDQIAIEINQIIDGVLAEGNHQTNGRFIFAGSRTLAPPFAATRNASGQATAIAYNGDDNHYNVDIGDGVVVPINQTGAEVFTASGPAGADIFNTLIQLRDNLTSGNINAVQDRLAELETIQEQIAIAQAHVGSVQNRLERTAADIDTVVVQQEQVVSDSIEADFAQVVIDLNAQQNAFQASLSAGARVIQPSLLNFIQ